MGRSSRALSPTTLAFFTVNAAVRLIGPKDVAVLIDRLLVLFARPSAISQHQGPTFTSELSVDALRDFIEATRGVGAPPRTEESPLPRTRRLDD